jgi:DNA/RNA endonuclease YhcR with UshA esterase domain
MNKIIPILSFLVLFTYSLLGQTVVSVSNLTSTQGEEVLVPINATISDVGSVNLNLEYDSTVLTFVEVTNSNLTGGSFVVNPQGDSLVSIAWFSTSPVDIATKILDLKFVYNGGTSAVSFVGANEIADGLSNPISTLFTDGSVGPEPLSFTLSDAIGVPGDTVEVEMTAVNLENIGAMNLYLNYDDSNATFLGLGDVNLAGFAANGVADRVNLGMFDANGFDHKSGVLATLKFEIIAGNTDLDFDASSFVQDVSFDNITTVYNNGSVGEANSTLLLGNVYAKIGEEVVVPMSALEIEKLGSFNLNVLVDSTVLEFVRVENVVSGTLVGNATGGTLSLGYFNADGLTVLDGPVADLVFNYLGESSDVSFDAASANIEDVDFNAMTVDLIDGSVLETIGPIVAEYPVVEAATDGTLDQPWTYNALGGVGTVVVADSSASAWGSHIVVYEDAAYTGLALINKIFTESYTVSSDIYLVGEQDATFPLYTGLAIKSAIEELKYYRFVYRNSTSDMGQLKLQGYDGAAWHISKTWNVGTEIDQLATGWHNFKITLDGDKIYAYMDGDLLSGSPISVTGDAAFLTQGMPGIFVYNAADSKVTFDNFKVEENVKLEYTVAEIQTPAVGDTTGDSPLDGMTVITSGVVTATKLNDEGAATEFYIQNGAGAYNGVLVYSTQSVLVGDQVTLQGEVDEYYGKTELKNVSGLGVSASGVELPEAVALSTAAVNDEMYEGVLVSISNAENIEENNNYGEAIFDDGSGQVMTDDAYSDAYQFFLGKVYDITGVVDYSFDNYKILYRNASDVFTPREDIMALDHNTGNLVMSVINNGSIGANKFNDVNYGVGIEWKGTNGLWRAGPMFGSVTTASANGQANNNNSVNFFDMTNVSSNFVAGLYAETVGTVEFDQVSSAAVFSDSLATTPYGLEITQKSYSKTGEDVVYIQYTYTNNTGADIADFSAGLFLDIDVATYTSNNGGYSDSEKLAYVYAAGTTDPYFGVAALINEDQTYGARVTTTNQADLAALRSAGYTFISTFDENDDPGTGDQRLWIGIAVGTISSGKSAKATFAFVAADDLHDLRANAEMAFITGKEAGFTNTVVSVDQNPSGIPTEYNISQNYPNPFNPATVIQYALPSQSNVKINVYNTLGQLVSKLVDSQVSSGYHQVQFNASNLSSGVYFYSIQAEAIDGSKSFQIVKKMMLVK